MAAGVASMLAVLVILFAIWQKRAPTVIAPTEGVVSITVEPDVEAVIGDRTYNQATLASVRLPFGDHRIEYRYQGRRIYSESVHVRRATLLFCNGARYWVRWSLFSCSRLRIPRSQ